LVVLGEREDYEPLSRGAFQKTLKKGKANEGSLKNKKNSS
jgi:hypothetical protein